MNSDSLEQFKLKVAEDLVYRHAWSICEDEDVPGLHEGCALYEAVDKNLHLIADIGAHLPYEVYDCQGELVGAFPYDRFADAFVEEVDWHDDRRPLEIVGPGERGDVPAPDYDPADVAFSEGAKQSIKTAFEKVFDEPVSNPYKLPRLVDAAPQRTVRDLRPGEVVILDGRWSICTKAFALVDLLDGAARNPRGDTPIDKVYRFAPEDQSLERSKI